jgi:hypothetical protein
MQTQMPDLGQEVEDTQVFTWNLPNWSALPRQLTSPEFLCGGHKWQVPGQLSDYCGLTYSIGKSCYIQMEILLRYHLVQYPSI